MTKNELDDLREVILEKLSTAAEPVAAADLLEELEEAGHDPARASFVLAHLLNHHDVRLDERQRFSLRVPAAS